MSDRPPGSGPGEPTHEPHGLEMFFGPRRDDPDQTDTVEMARLRPRPDPGALPPPGPVPGWGPREVSGPGAHGRPDGWAAPTGAPLGPVPPTGPTGRGPLPPPRPSWAPPAGAAPATATTLPPARPTGTRRRGVIGVAALTALVVGGAAGLGGAVVGSQLAAGPVAPSAAPSASTQPTVAAPAPVPSGGRSTQPAVGVAAAVLPSTVTIESGSSTGSGFVLGDDGTIMTNNHVVASAAEDGSGEVKVVFDDGTRAQATIVGRSPGYDLAVIQVQDEAPLTPVRIGSSEGVAIGQSAVAVGSPLGLGGTVTEGIISALDRPVVVGGGADAQGASAYINAIQTDAPINPGNSGGPLVDGEGRVIGINSAILSLGAQGGDAQGGNIGVGFAIPIDQAMEIGRLLIEDGEATYPVIGAQVRTQPDDSGVLLDEITPGGAAERAGLRRGDVVASIDGERVWETVELIVSIRTHRPGETVTLGVLRDGRTREVAVELEGEVG
ncbi:S1C family serine protease [Auraticoccus monumenti]|uniref:Putative serine protease PepD n=1 Tax=Auraticoccus monumenti TaxID=675864 RepID=A0A1G7ADL5_9ACTN|nr:trypsin-like peptidase domain-containing protein [Auraticoccus monumenti]SDE12773.1 putative serine protease PepD [Auraticoccus monumenti]